METRRKWLAMGLSLILFSTSLFSARPARNSSIVHVHVTDWHDDEDLKSVILNYFDIDPGHNASVVDQLIALYKATEGNLFLMYKFLMTYWRS